MKYFIIIALFVALLSPALIQHAFGGDETVAARDIDVTDPQSIEDASKVSAALDDVSASVLECAKTEDTPQLCQCRFPEEMGRVRTAYDMALKKHPNWRNTNATFHAPGKTPATLSFPDVAQRLEECR